jgi:hypothetical protein
VLLGLHWTSQNDQVPVKCGMTAAVAVAVAVAQVRLQWQDSLELEPDTSHHTSGLAEAASPRLTALLASSARWEGSMPRHDRVLAKNTPLRLHFLSHGLPTKDFRGHKFDESSLSMTYETCLASLRTQRQGTRANGDHVQLTARREC